MQPPWESHLLVLLENKQKIKENYTSSPSDVDIAKTDYWKNSQHRDSKSAASAASLGDKLYLKNSQLQDDKKQGACTETTGLA